MMYGSAVMCIWMKWAGVGCPYLSVIVKGMKLSLMLWMNPSGGWRGSTPRAGAACV